MDTNRDGKVTREEFVNACLRDETIKDMTVPSSLTGFKFTE